MRIHAAVPRCIQLILACITHINVQLLHKSPKLMAHQNKDQVRWDRWSKWYSRTSEISNIWTPHGPGLTQFGASPGVGSLGRTVVLFLVLRGTSTLFSIVAVPISTPSNDAQGFPFLHILTNTWEVMAHRGSNLHFLHLRLNRKAVPLCLDSDSIFHCRCLISAWVL